MEGDFSVFHFDPHEHERGVDPLSQGVLRNINSVLHQQGRVITDADLTEGELLELLWNSQAGRDIIGAGVCAVPAIEPRSFRVDSALVSDSEVRLMVQPGRAWVDGILTRLAGTAANPTAAVERRAHYFGPPLTDTLPQPSDIGDGTRDAVILEVSEEALHGFQYPDRLIEPALGGPDTSERSYVNVRFRLLRLTEDEDCTNILDRLKDDPSTKGRLSVSLAPATVIAGDCPIVGGGGYLGFEHNLYRIEIADGERFKWSQWNGGLVGRGRFDATVNPNRVIIDAGRIAIVNSGLTEFYLEALQYNELDGTWNVIYGTTATLNTEHELELSSPPTFGTLPATTDPVFFRLWNGLRNIADFSNAVNPVELQVGIGIRLVFDAPVSGNYQARDYWTFTVRAGEIFNPDVLLDHVPPQGIVYHRVPLAEINWTARRNTTVSGTIEDCRKRFRPLTQQKVCCTFLIGDGVSSFGDFNSLEEAAAHLPTNGGELCLLPGMHRANLSLDGKHNIKIHGCEGRSLVLPRSETRTQPILYFLDCAGIEVSDLDLVTYDGIAVAIEGRSDGKCRNVHINNNRMIARINAVRATNIDGLLIANNRLHLLDTSDGLATISIAADDVLIERNTLVLLPFVDTTPDEPETPDENPTRDPADPCAKPEILYMFPKLVWQYALHAWVFVLAQLIPKQPYRAVGGIHVRAGSEKIRILENTIIGGAGNGITLGGDLDPIIASTVSVPRSNLGEDSTRREINEAIRAGDAALAKVKVAVGGQFLARVQDEQAKSLENIDAYLEGETIATDRSDKQGMISIKAVPGDYILSVSPEYRIIRVNEEHEEGIVVNIVTVERRVTTVSARGFLHEITMEANDISIMGLSGIGFAFKSNIRLFSKAVLVPSNDPRGALLAYLDAIIFNFALTSLLRATDPVFDLVIRNNRIHHNLRNPFTDAMREETQIIGIGGISLAIVESTKITGNHVYDNGLSASDPVCGVFIGYGNDLEITDNVLATNGVEARNIERVLQEGLRGGLYIRFAGALTTQFSTSTGRKPALRVHDNRVDQPVGRALTAFTFGPVSVANNHFNCEFTGRFNFLDAVVGNTLILNIGGIHRILARLFGRYMKNFDTYGSQTIAFSRQTSFATIAELALPGGETIFDDNYLRLGIMNRSLTSQLLLAYDDLGYASNTTSVFKSDPLFANAVLIADTLRVTASRFREDANRTISLLSWALRINTTALNQADHCIVVLPFPQSQTPRLMDGNLLPTAAFPNQVLDWEICQRAFAERGGLGQWFSQTLAVNANELGGTMPQNAFTTAEVANQARLYTAKSITNITSTQVAISQAYQMEAVRLSVKRGKDYPKAIRLRAQVDAGVHTLRLLSSGAEAVTATIPTVSETTSALSGRFVNERGQGQEGYTVELLNSVGARVYTVGRTDNSGFFAAVFDQATTSTLSRAGELFPRVTDAVGKEVFRANEAIRIEPEANIQTTLTVPVRIVPKTVVVVDAEPPCEPQGDTDIWIVQGRITDIEGKGLAGFIVSVYDKDLLFDDSLGTTETDQNGNYRLTYHTRDFRDLIENNPDLYIKITDGRGNLCHTTEDAVRWNAGRTEIINIVLRNK